MKIPKKLILLVIVLFFILVLVNPRNKKVISGKILDCLTNQPIPNAEIWTHQIGWGLQGGVLVMDKSYVTRARSDEYGNFSITYKVGKTASINTIKKGYYNASQYSPPTNNFLIKMLPGIVTIRNEGTQYCTFDEDCLRETRENGVRTVRNICNKYEN